MVSKAAATLEQFLAEDNRRELYDSLAGAAASIPRAFPLVCSWPTGLLVGAIAVLLRALGDHALTLAIAPGSAPLVAGAALALLLAAYRLVLTPVRRKTKDYHDPTSSRYKALKARSFPPGFPNGWHCVCNLTDLEGGAVKRISALGTHLVAFQGADRRVGVLDAFCPHMGAHLGEGGKVVGDLLRCPFHGWSFDADGKCRAIPYSPGGCVPERTSTRAWEVRVHLERVFVWFDAEGRPPAWELQCHRDVEEGLASGRYYLGATAQLEFDMHVLEMHMNSADPHHLNTLHAALPLPVLGRFIQASHSITQAYGEGDVCGEKVKAPQFCHLTERTSALYYFGLRSLPVPGGAWSSSMVSAEVTFEGPSIVNFTVRTPFGTLRQVMTLLAVEPFKQFVESRWYAEPSVPRLVVFVFGLIGRTALEQDRRVWENRMFTDPVKWVPGDGPMPQFIRWYRQFYSKSSAAVGKATLEW
jgi:cholesterol 7-dehydrogenase